MEEERVEFNFSVIEDDASGGKVVAMDTVAPGCELGDGKEEKLAAMAQPQLATKFCVLLPELRNSKVPISPKGNDDSPPPSDSVSPVLVRAKRRMPSLTPCHLPSLHPPLPYPNLLPQSSSPFVQPDDVASLSPPCFPGPSPPLNPLPLLELSLSSSS